MSPYDGIAREGFAVLHGAVRDLDIDPVRERLAELIDDDRASSYSNPVDDFMVQNLMLRDRRFLDLLAHTAIIGAFDALLGTTSIVYAYTSSSLPARGTNYSNRIHVDCPRVIPGYITNIGVIVPLDDFTGATGGTRFLPRSFEQIEPPDRETFERDAVRPAAGPGDLIVFNARTWHEGGLNTTDRDRHAVTINGCRSYMRQRFDYPRMIPADVAAALPESTLRLLGFHVQVPTTLEDYYAPADRRGYRPGQG